MSADYTVKLVEQDGAGSFDVIQELEQPVFTSPVTKQLNGIGSTTFGMSPNDPNWIDFYNALGTDWLKREVQIYRGAASVPWWWGVPIRPTKTLGSQVLGIQCAEFPWLFTKRYFGKAARTNLLLNPQFAEGAYDTDGVIEDWEIENTTAEADTAGPTILGITSARLEQSDAGQDAFIFQQVGRTAGGIGDVISVVAWFYIDPGAWVGPAYNNRGLFVERISAGNVVQQVANYAIDENTPRGQWIRAEIPLDQSLWMPPSAAETLEFRLYSPGGVIYWGASFMGLMESFSSAMPGGSDIATLAAGIVGHAQDPAYAKDDLDIGTTGSATGRLLARAWQHAEHGNIWNNGLQELIALEDGIDIGWDMTATTRTMHSYSRVDGALGLGNDRTALDMSLSGPYVLDYGWVKDGGQAASSLTVLGPGDGPDREEGSFIDATKFGGRTMEAVITAPNNATIDSLNQRAAKAGADRSRPHQIDVALMPGQLIDGDPYIGLGDRFIGSFDAQIDADTYRVVELALNPNTDHMTIGANPTGEGV